MANRKSKSTVWIDFENAPHVWVLSPLIEHLRQTGHPLILTARDFSCTTGLCRRMGYQVQVVGRPGAGKTPAAKLWRGAERALALYLNLRSRRQEVGLALSHGSRAQILAAHSLGVPVLTLDDYEFSDQSLVRFVDHLLVPFPIPKETWGRFAAKVTWYPGQKEDLYLAGFQPPQEVLAELRDTEQVKVLLRPEGRFTHYRSAQSEIVQQAILDYLAGRPDVFLVLLPRDTEQGAALVRFCQEHGIAHWVPRDVLDGPALIWAADLVIGGGGTMTREAAALGVPAYSFFAGQWGAVDHHLEEQGRLIRLAETGDVQKIALVKRPREAVRVPSDALRFVTHFVDALLDGE